MSMNIKLEELRLSSLRISESYIIMAHMHSLAALRLPLLESTLAHFVLSVRASADVCIAV